MGSPCKNSLRPFQIQSSKIKEEGYTYHTQKNVKKEVITDEFDTIERNLPNKYQVYQEF